jgi:DNA-binding beta-propeller fold protein YncE
VAVDVSDKFVYVVDNGNDRIQKFDSNGNFITSWGTQGSDNGQFFRPLDVAVDPSDKFVYVADTQNARIQKFFNNGTFVTTWGSGCNIFDGSGCVIPKNPGHLSLGDGQFNSVGGIAFAPSGTFVYVADTGNNRIQVFAPDIFQSTAANLTKTNTSSRFPMIAATQIGNNVYEVWQGNTTG